MSVFGLHYLTCVIVNLFFKKATKITSCICGGSSPWYTGAFSSSEHLWETAVSHSWGYYWGTWLEHKPSHEILTFLEVNIATELRTYFKSASATEFPQCWGRRLSLRWWSHCSGCDRGQGEWLNCCVHQQPLQLTLVGFFVGFESFVTWQTCEVFIADADILPAPWLAFPCNWDRWVWHMKLKIVLPLKAKRRENMLNIDPL